MPCLPPASNASFGDYIQYYTQRNGITINRLATCARMNQPHLYKIINGAIHDVPVDILVNICLALRLSVEEAKDLLARKERAFSPADPAHQVYLRLIGDYHGKAIDYKDTTAIMDFLREADETLRKVGFAELPKSRNYLYY